MFTTVGSRAHRSRIERARAGGTGVANPTAHSLPVAEGGNAWNFLGPLTNGQLQIGSTGVDPVIAALAIQLGSRQSITNGAGSITFGSILPRGYIDGLVTSTAGSSTTLTVAVGICRDDTDAFDLALSSSLAGVLGATWAAGGGSNKLDTGSPAASTWYHVFVIRKTSDGSADVLFSTSVSSPTMPAGYSGQRRIGSFKSDGSKNVTLFHQYGDEFLWDVGLTDINTTVGTTATNFTLTVPTGVKVWAQLTSIFTGTAVLIYSSDQSDETVGGTVWTDQSAVGPGAPTFIRTNTSAQIRARGSTNGLSIQVRTIGWRDPRGRDV